MSDSEKNSDDRLRLCTGDVIRNYLDLTRFPGVFTAVADVSMGFLIAAYSGPSWRPDAREFWTWIMLAAASAMFYAAGMVLNNLFDVERDFEQRPERPLPSGRVSIDAARRLGWTLLWGGLALGVGAGLITVNLRTGIVAALLATTIMLYNGWLKPTLLGPPAMGACRFLNVMLGINAVATVQLGADLWLVAGAIGVYVTGITWFARRESQRGNPLQLGAATLVMVLGIVMLGCFPSVSDRVMSAMVADPQRWFMLIGIIGLIIVWRCFRAVVDPTSVKVRMAVAQCIMSIAVLDAIACLAVCGVYWASWIVLLIIPAMFFGRLINVT